MQTINLETDPMDLAGADNLAESGPVLILSAGKEFLVSAVDDFEMEVATLRNSVPFQAFLDERRRSVSRISIDELEGRLAESPD